MQASKYQAPEVVKSRKQITVTGILIVRFAEGKVVEVWDQGDDLGALQQLSLIPVAQPAG